MTDNHLTKDELNKIFIDTFWLQLGWNYEVMQGLGYVHGMERVLEKNYLTEEERIAAAKTYMEFFNCNPHLATTITGINVALEEEQPGNLDMARSVKLSLMGPLSSIGDTLVVAVFGSIIFALDATLAMSGSQFAWFAGLMPILFYTLPVNYLRYKLFFLGHKYGTTLFTEQADKFELIKKYGYMFGLIVIGGLAASMVKVNLIDNIMIGDVQLALGSSLNSIFPGLVTLLATLLAYWSLGLEKMNSTRLLLLVLILGTLLGALGILV